MSFKKILSGITASAVMLTAGVIPYKNAASGIPGTGITAGAEDDTDIPTEGVCGENLTWELDPDSGLLTISGSGPMYDYGSGKRSPFKEMGFYANAVRIEEGVTSVGEEAFNNCWGVFAVFLPDSLTSIGKNAFIGTSLMDIDIPESVVSIGKDAFRRTPMLQEQDDPSGIKYAGTWAVSCDEKVTSAGIKEGTKGIAESAFEPCSSLAEIKLPDGLEKISGRAFYGCSALKKINIPDSVTNIAKEAFMGTGLADYEKDRVSYVDKWLIHAAKDTADIIIDNGTKGIADSAFEECSALAEINIPASLANIGQDAFYGCEALEKVNITDAAAWCGIDFGNNYSNPLCYAHDLYLNGGLLTDLTITDTVTALKDNAFYSCGSLKSVTVPDSVRSIGDHAFYLCKALESITIKNPECVISSDNSICSRVEDFSGTKYCFFDGTIYGHNNSGAKEYAEKNRYKFVSLDGEPSVTTTAPPSSSGTTTTTAVSGGLDPEKYAVWLDSAAGAPGETVKIGINVKCNGKFDGLEANVNWDDPALLASAPKKGDIGAVVLASDVQKCSCAMILISLSGSPDGKAASIDFRIPNDALPGTVYDLKIGEKIVLNEYDGESYDTGIPAFGGSITVTDPAEMKLSSASALPGETVSLILTAYSVEAPESFDACLKWDDKELKAVNAISDDEAPKLNIKESEDGLLRITGNISGSSCAKIDFRIPENAVPGTAYNIVLTDDSVVCDKSAHKFSGAGLKRTNAVITVDEPPVTTTEATTTAVTTTVTTTVTTVTTAAPAVKGDANEDGVLNVRDAAFIAKMLSKGRGEELPHNADFNGDGVVNVRDAAAIAKSLAGGGRVRGLRPLTLQTFEKV